MTNEGHFPPAKNPERRLLCKSSFKAFCKTYFPGIFRNPWSTFHDRAILKIERAVLVGGLFVDRMPVSTGKTTLSSTACLWAALSGEMKYVCLVAPSRLHANTFLCSISLMMRTSVFYEDFPEIADPIRVVFGGSTSKMVFPTSGTAIEGVGMDTRGFCGLTHVCPGGDVVRPDFVMIDDPMATGSCETDAEFKRRESLLCGQIPALSGIGREISGVMLHTPHYRDAEYGEDFLSLYENDVKA